MKFAMVHVPLSARCHWSGPWHSSDSPCLAPSSESRPVFIQLRTFCQDFFLQVTGTKTRSKGWKPFHVAFYSLVTDGSLNFIWGSQISELAQAGRSRSRGETNKSKNYLSWPDQTRAGLITADNGLCSGIQGSVCLDVTPDYVWAELEWGKLMIRHAPVLKSSGQICTAGRA